MKSQKAILLVDDDDDLRLYIGQYLRQHELEVIVAGDGREMDAALARNRIDLIILDLMLPGEDGLSICRRMVGPDKPPVIVLSAMGEETDRVVGLELGADDYLPKPCSPRELLARVRAVLRRRESSGVTAASAPQRSAAIYFDGFTLNLLRRQLYAPDGSVIVLSSNEFSLLVVLLERPNQIIDREALARLAGIGDPDEVDRAVDMQVSRLRKKIHAAAKADVILTVRGQGYQLAAQSVHGMYEAPAGQAVGLASNDVMKAR